MDDNKLTANDAAIRRMVNLNHVHGAAGCHQRHTESQNKTTAHELASSVAGSLNNGACVI